MNGPARHVAVSAMAENALCASALNRLFHEARTPRTWLDRPVARELVECIYAAARMGPTSMNSTPAHFVFITSPEGRERLRPALSPGNAGRALAAPVIAIIARDHDFVRRMPVQWPHADTGRLFAARPHLVETTARRNATLQGAWFIMAARPHGLDCGPMSGFDAGKVDAAFFEGTARHSEFLCCLGYGDPSTLKPRLPRPEFGQACRWA